MARLFDFLFGKMIDRRIAAYQNDIVERHLDEVQNMYRQVRGWRHDFANHVHNMNTLLEKGDHEELKSYLDKMGVELRTVDTVLKTGNVMVDAALNSKITLAMSKRIAVNAKATVPDKLTVSEVELCALIGNLLNNAIEGCLTLEKEEERFIRVYIGVLKGQLYISVTNSYLGIRTRENGKYRTTKDDSGSHGFGLLRIDSIAKKYGGYVNRQHEEGVFATEVMLPL